MSSCTSLGYPYGKHGTNEAKVDGSPYPFGECTDLIWRHYRDQGVRLAPHMGDAWEWLSSAATQSYTVYDHVPAPNVIACWDRAAYPGFGHLAVVDRTNADGSYVVKEMNFCYGVSSDPGHMDERTVSSTDKQPRGFILPTGAGLGAGALVNTMSAQLGPIAVPDIAGQLAGIGKSIEGAGLQVEANLATLRQRLTSGAQIGLGAGLVAGGATVIGLAALGHSPGRLASRGARTLRRRARRDALPAVREQFPASTPQLPELPPGPARPGRIPAARASRSLRPRPAGMLRRRRIPGRPY